ncbi:MAG TPA: transglycosylase SLT domain-containing protein [Terriglobales bacterium]|nr:transglycosylase SLT domain-containing protein [Terriglobales bacterium]
MSGANAIYELIGQACQRTGLAWWLIYGVIEQESGFDPRAESECGAAGLMQLMPASFPEWPPAELFDPAVNVRLGSEFLRECIGIWKKEAPDEAIKFGLASYNGGCGYVLRAQAAAQAAHADPSLWSAVETHLAAVEVNGKQPDVEQISGYVRTIWGKYAERRGMPVPTAVPA